MLPKHQPATPRAAAFAFSFLTILFFSQPILAQNLYPASGDALIHGLTVGTGAGAGTTYNTALGAGALSSNSSGFSSVAIGYGALGSNSSGYWNTATGVSSLNRNTTGAGNTAHGFAALDFNVNGNNNTAHGSQAMEFNTSGNNNTADANLALYSNTTGSNNTAMGFSALGSNRTGNSNTAVGIAALSASTGGSNQVAVGDSSLTNNNGGIWNTALGSKTLYTNITGQQNVAVGYQALYFNTTGNVNTAVGSQALYHNQSGMANSAFGLQGLYANTTGGYNMALGNVSLYSNTSGSYNTAVGEWSLYYNTTGAWNCALGIDALQSNTTGNFNTAIGNNAGVYPGTVSNATGIGNGAVASASNSVVIGNSSVTSIGGYTNWTNFSDGRYKKNITRNVPGLAFINLLNPVTYTLDINGIESKLHPGQKSPEGPDGITLPNPLDNPIVKQAMSEKSQVVYTGFVAQDVDKAAQSIGYNFSGVDKPKNDQQSFYGLRYADFVVPLVKAVQELSVANDSLKAANAQLGARLDQIEQILGIQSNTQNASVLSLSSARLYQNAPNPFNQSTLINYYLPQNSTSALLRINGINGEPIKSFVISGTGNGQVTLQTSQLAAGTYTYSLIVDGNLIDTKKMILAK